MGHLADEGVDHLRVPEESIGRHVGDEAAGLQADDPGGVARDQSASPKGEETIRAMRRNITENSPSTYQ